MYRQIWFRSCRRVFSVPLAGTKKYMFRVYQLWTEGEGVTFISIIIWKHIIHCWQWKNPVAKLGAFCIFWSCMFFFSCCDTGTCQGFEVRHLKCRPGAPAFQLTDDTFPKYCQSPALFPQLATLFPLKPSLWVTHAQTTEWTCQHTPILKCSSRPIPIWHVARWWSHRQRLWLALTAETVQLRWLG